ncbi:hypothetical protein [Pandoraea sp. SD6-2]|uniref:hypothetical protein n=1 Tax=Pandoraea sp. SD6-2 TaxID=1286093 RepID=UPI00143B6524|nr:hypothetical protein [Pandoraea sp. SD6-2]
MTTDLQCWYQPRPACFGDAGGILIGARERDHLPVQPVNHSPKAILLLASDVEPPVFNGAD